MGGRAALELVLTGVTCGALGVQVVLRRLAFFTETLGHVVFLGIVAATVAVVAAAPAVGATLPPALLVGPAATALLWTRRVVPATLLGGLLGALSGVAGPELSLRYRLAASATVAVLCGGLFLVTVAARGRWVSAPRGT
jgi:ABC-type Mn2+/Zn2+ transport system permease subunit